MRFRYCLFMVAAMVGFLVSSATAGLAAESGQVILGPSGNPLPRFVSLKSSRVNLRIGPGRSYPVDWMYTRTGLPMEIVQEYDTWRRVRDSEGTEGWILQSLLSGRRTAMAAPWMRGTGDVIELRSSAGNSAGLTARVEPGAVGKVLGCDGSWCEMDFDGHRGWVQQLMIWGVYPGETISR